MQRWWFTDDKTKEGKNNRTEQRPKKTNDQQRNGFNIRECKFSVFVNKDLNSNEKVAITGNIDELGNWDPNYCVFLSQTTDGNIWSVVLNIPSNLDINYRYFIASIDESQNPPRTHVRKWETHLHPRRFFADQQSTAIDTFGVIDGIEKVDSGWLTNETLIHLKFMNNPFVLKERIKNRQIYVKITPMNMRLNAESSSNVQSIAEDSMSNDAREYPSAYAYTEVATLNANNDDYLFSEQEQHGRQYKDNDIMFFRITISEPEDIAYCIDLFGTKDNNNTPPKHLGYHYLLPNMLKNSEGTLELTITCATTHRPLGMMRVQFLKVTPLNNPRCDMEVTYERYWNNKHQGLDVGHRGTGTSFKTTSGHGVIRENTIASLKKAGESGAQFVEFDVQLSKDLHPVIYHDFKVYVSLKKKTTLEENDMLELPMRELTLEQLKNLKVYHVVEGRTKEAKFFDENLAEHQPFPELAEALEVIDEKLGFNIEIKSAQPLEDGTLEDEHLSIDKNLYVDSILDVVLAKAGKRRIVFSCFDPDVCIMLRYKQNIYPTMFLTLGRSERYPGYLNPCCNTIENASKFCVANELLGIVAHSEDLLRDMSQVNMVRDKSLCLFCWGEDNNCKDTIKFLKEKGLHGIIYDRIDTLIEKDVYIIGAETKRDSELLKQMTQ
ncbi:hypothetical protein PVAND_005554 [Polypedilum vanderplanki]|uniref:Uncharacterized protein n=1 Tax=Polypedilum vanderplanki TaxID=319348 RepID=A0A9J6C1I0_POLVA|nr:hypothetical protein PVAND_005554 [Polypedilum vanderplanki]